MDFSINHIRQKAASFFSNTKYLAIWTAFVLIVPNIVICITESSGGIWKAADVTLPLGVYMLILASCRKIGITTLLTMPFMILAAFQLVLSYLYGESIIAVDMFLNVVTTNFDEATELLANLLPAIVTVVLLYLPPIIWGIASTCRKWLIPELFRRRFIIGGMSLSAIGLLMSAWASAIPGYGVFHREIFPVNVIENMAEAVHRTKETARYEQTSKDFTYKAIATHPAEEREIYLFVIGETSRAINWELYGYDRPTNPRLKHEANVVFCPRAISESNTTHKSVPMLMSSASSENFDSISHFKSIITAMKEAGFYTRFYSNQAPNRSYTQFFGDEADDIRYSDFSASHHPFDTDLLPWIAEAVADSVHAKQFIVLHTYGSHFLYRDRYPQESAVFTPDKAIDASPRHRSDLINAYDNSIHYTDEFLSKAIQLINNEHCMSALIYSADHGEDIFDDSRERFLHASPHPTYYQLHVAMLVWLSDETAGHHPDFMKNLASNATKPLSPQKSMFNTAMEIAGVQSPQCDPTHSLVSSQFMPCLHPVYLTDLNQPVPLGKSGIKNIDKEKLSKILDNAKF